MSSLIDDQNIVSQAERSLEIKYPLRIESLSICQINTLKKRLIIPMRIDWGIVKDLLSKEKMMMARPEQDNVYYHSYKEKIWWIVSLSWRDISDEYICRQIDFVMLSILRKSFWRRMESSIKFDFYINLYKIYIV